MLVVVGGHSRNIGKTSVVTGLIEALPQGRWTAVKITQHGHGICSIAGQPCECMIACDAPYALSEQSVADRTDSGRYLAAGARRSYWLRTPAGELGRALPALQEILKGSENAIVESNSVLEFVKPELYLVVLDFSVSDVKESSLRFVHRADAFIAIERGASGAPWKTAIARWLAEKPNFAAITPGYAGEDLVRFVEDRLWPRGGQAGRGNATARLTPPPGMG